MNNLVSKMQIGGSIVILLSFLPLPSPFYLIESVLLLVVTAILAACYVVNRSFALALLFVLAALLFQPFWHVGVSSAVMLYAKVITGVVMLILLACRR